jgi:hypothetical protein
LMGSSTNRNYTPVGRFFYILISMLHLFLNSETLVLIFDGALKRKP